MGLRRLLTKVCRFFIYEHERIGYTGNQFKMLKFRTMILNSDELFPLAETTYKRNARGVIINDPRITEMGRFLKKYRIDELAQWVNILKGEMAIIGPRPHSRFFYKKYVPDDLREIRILVKPGWLKPRMAYADFDFGGLEFTAERKYLAELKRNPGLTKIRYAIRAILPSCFKWQFIPGGKKFNGSNKFEDKLV
jgi:hypothetical protein